MPLDEAIMEAMTALDNLWDNMHHRASFLPDLECLEVNIKNHDLTNNVQWYQYPIMIHDVYA
jgi:hypothetical protein